MALTLETLCRSGGIIVEAEGFFIPSKKKFYIVELTVLDLKTEAIIHKFFDLFVDFDQLNSSDQFSILGQRRRNGLNWIPPLYEVTPMFRKGKEVKSFLTFITKNQAVIMTSSEKTQKFLENLLNREIILLQNFMEENHFSPFIERIMWSDYLFESCCMIHLNCVYARIMAIHDFFRQIWLPEEINGQELVTDE